MLRPWSAAGAFHLYFCVSYLDAHRIIHWAALGEILFWPLQIFHVVTRQSHNFGEYSTPSDTVLLKTWLAPKDAFKTSILGNTHSYTGHNHILGKTAIICPLESGLKQQLRSSNYIHSLWSLCVQDLKSSINVQFLPHKEQTNLNKKTNLLFIVSHEIYKHTVWVKCRNFWVEVIPLCYEWLLY